MTGVSMSLAATTAPLPVFAGRDCLAPASPEIQPVASASEVATVGRLSGSRLKSALVRGFGIQYWGETYTVEDLAASPHGVLILEATHSLSDGNAQGREQTFTADELSRIRGDGDRRLIGYLNLTEIETYRDYWQGQAGCAEVGQDCGWVGPLTQDGERLAQYWQPSWEAILNARVDRLMELGFDGIMFDDVLHYFTYMEDQELDWRAASNGVDVLDVEVGYASAMLALVSRLSARARQGNPDAIIIVNNGVFLPFDVEADLDDGETTGLLDRYFQSIDGILVESSFGPHAIEATRTALATQYIARGKSVLAVDFTHQYPALSEDVVRHVLDRRATLRGFVPYVADGDAFDRLYPPRKGRMLGAIEP